MTVPVTVSCLLPNNSVFPLAGCDIIWTVHEGGSAILTKSTALVAPDDITIAANSFSFTITAADSLLLPYGDTDDGARHEAKLQTVAAQVFPVMVGNIRTADSLIVAF